MLQHLQEYDFQVVHRAGNRHTNDDGLSSMLEDELPDWQPGEREDALGVRPEAKTLEEVLKDLGHTASTDQAFRSSNLVGTDDDSVTRSRTDNGARELQEKDEAISQILYWALDASKRDCSSLGTNCVTKAEATKYGEEVMA